MTFGQILQKFRKTVLTFGPMASFMALVYFFILHSQLPAWQPECCSVAAESCMSFKIGFKVNLFKFWLQNWEKQTRGGGESSEQHQTPGAECRQELDARKHL